MKKKDFELVTPDWMKEEEEDNWGFDTRRYWNTNWVFNDNGFEGFCAASLPYCFVEEGQSLFYSVLDVLWGAVSDRCTLVIMGANKGHYEYKIMKFMQKMQDTGNNFVYLPFTPTENSAGRVRWKKIKFELAWADDKDWVNKNSGNRVNAVFVRLTNLPGNRLTTRRDRYLPQNLPDLKTLKKKNLEGRKYD